MAIKFQYNKTSLQSLDKQLKMRVRALPTIKNKESALRSEVKKAKEVADEFDGKLDDTLNGISDMLQLYDEYTPDILTVKDVNMSVKKIAGVRTPVLDQVEYEIKDFSLFNAPDGSLTDSARERSSKYRSRTGVLYAEDGITGSCP